MRHLQGNRDITQEQKEVSTGMRAKTETVAVIRKVGRIRSVIRNGMRTGKKPKLAGCLILIGHVGLSRYK